MGVYKLVGVVSSDEKTYQLEHGRNGLKCSKARLFLPAGRTQSARPARPKITLLFPRLYICASALITCAIITSRTLLPCDLT